MILRGEYLIDQVELFAARIFNARAVCYRSRQGGQYAAHIVAGLGTRLDQAAVFQQLPGVQYGIDADLMSLCHPANSGQAFARLQRALMDRLGETVGKLIVEWLIGRESKGHKSLRESWVQ